jgi:hypothetical protein
MCFALRGANATAAQAVFSRRACCASRSQGVSSAELARSEAKETELQSGGSQSTGEMRSKPKRQARGMPVRRRVRGDDQYPCASHFSAHGARARLARPASRAALAFVARGDLARKKRLAV